MSNRNALKKLIKAFPAPPDIERIMASLQKESDMSIAITATAILEASLERLITSKFKTKTSELVGQIFLNRGPLSDFHSKILVAKAFGIITSPMADELNSIKAVRNVFAHCKNIISFDHELLAKEVRSLKMLVAMQRVAKEDGREFEMSNKGWFLLLVQLLLIMFDGIETHPGTADDALRDASPR